MAASAAQEGDLVFARSGATVGKTYLHRESTEPAVYAGYLIKFELDSRQILPEYAFRYTQSPQYWAWVTSAQRAVAQPNINAKQYATLPIPLPPLDEQQRIARILSVADDLRTKRQDLLAHLEDVGRSIFLEMFGDPYRNPCGWEMRPLGSVSEKFSDGPFGSNLKSSHYVDSGVRVIRLQNIGAGHFVDTDKRSSRANTSRNFVAMRVRPETF